MLLNAFVPFMVFMLSISCPNAVLNRTTGAGLVLCYSKHKTSAAEVGPVQAIVRATMLTIAHTFDRGNLPKMPSHRASRRAPCVNTASFSLRTLNRSI